MFIVAQILEELVKERSNQPRQIVVVDVGSDQRVFQIAFESSISNDIRAACDVDLFGSNSRGYGNTCSSDLTAQKGSFLYPIWIGAEGSKDRVSAFCLEVVVEVTHGGGNRSSRLQEVNGIEHKDCLDGNSNVQFPNDWVFGRSANFNGALLADCLSEVNCTRSAPAVSAGF